MEYLIENERDFDNLCRMYPDGQWSSGKPLPHLKTQVLRIAPMVMINYTHGFTGQTLLGYRKRYIEKNYRKPRRKVTYE